MTLPSILLVSEGAGFNPLDLSGIGGTFWTLVIFLLALVPIWKLVMGPVTRAMEARDEQAASAIAAAEKASKDAESAKNAVDARLREAQLEASKLLDGARVRGEAREREIVEDANKKAGALLERAKGEIRNEQDKALAAIRRQVVDLSMSAAGQVLKRKVDSADDKRLVEELVASANKDSKS